jgi:mono/diheme cytochrome c family protein
LLFRRPFTAVTLVALAALAVCGCAKTTRQSATSTSAVTSPAANPGAEKSVAAAPAGDAAHGKTIFKEKCEVCHGVGGVGGGVGPTLINEKKRKNLTEAIAWIKNPTSPMPKYYPAELDEKGVADVAAFVESL